MHDKVSVSSSKGVATLSQLDKEDHLLSVEHLLSVDGFRRGLAEYPES